MKYCPDCKHFIYCDPYKILHYKCCTDEECPEFDEKKKGGGENARSEV
jgi:hypothetical protein